MTVQRAIENYLAILLVEGGAERERISSLVEALDELALLADRVSFDSDDNHYPNPPDKNPHDIYAAVTKRFPSLGFYRVALDICDDTENGAVTAGYAVEDLVDVAGDMQEVLWRLSNTSQDDALFHFQLLFRSHWGHHLRRVQLYLHELVW
jgi:hypothetical protein